MLKQSMLTLFSAGILTTITYAQNKVTVSGFVREAGSRESLPGVILQVKDAEVFATTNEHGYYSLSLPPGDYVLQLYYPGYSDTSLELKLQESKSLDLSITPRASLETVVVTAQAGHAQEVRGSTHQLSAEQVKNLPALLGEKDVFKVVKLLPGVQKGQEGSSGFNVRGGNTDQNLIILDDAVVYNASHLFGFISIFNGDAIKGIELIKGGFPAKYGERLSSVLNITMKDGDKQKYKGEVGLGLLSSRATLEGPIKKNKASFLLSARRSYADILAAPVIKAIDSEAPGIGAHFHDFNAKLNYQVDKKNSIYLSGYLGRDRFSSKDKSSENFFKTAFSWGNTIGSLRWNHVFNPKLFANMSLNYSNYRMAIKLEERYEGEVYKMSLISAIDDIGGKYDISYFANNNHTIRAGYKITRHYFKPSTFVEIDNGQKFPNKNKEYESWEHNLYLDDEWKLSKNLAANLGLRGTAFNSGSKTYFNLEPRVSARFLIGDQTSIKASYTIMNQYMHLLSSSSLNLPSDLWVPATDKIGPQRAQQYSLGLFKDLENPGLSLSLEGYYKDMSNIISYREGVSFFEMNDPADLSNNGAFENKVTSGVGHSYGGELMVQKPKGRLNGWLAYTLSWTKFKFPDINNGEYFFPRFDRRHDVNLVGFYELTPKIRINALFTVATGNPVVIAKQDATVLSNLPADGSLTNPDIRSYQTSVFSGRNDFRTELYHRMDIGIQFSKERRKGTRTWEFSFYNVYNRKNPFFYSMEYNNTGTERGLYKYTIFPFIPSFTYSFKFK